jgi:hypothetical protein
MRIAVEKFQGEIPVLTDNLLPDGYAMLASNCQLIHEDLRALKSLDKEEAISPTTCKSLFCEHGHKK